MFKNWAWWALGAVGCVAAGLLWAALENPPFGSALLTFLNGHDKALTLLVLTVSVVFGIAQWWTTRAGSRRDFIATHRPRIRVRFISGGSWEEDTRREVALVRIANIGVSEAIVVGIARDIARRKKNSNRWLAPGLNEGLEKIDPVVLGPGQPHYFYARSQEPITDEQIFKEAAMDLERCVVGKICYEDRNHTLRETRFFRVWDRETNGFVPVEEEEYED
jgi:hypothetical protein